MAIKALYKVRTSPTSMGMMTVGRKNSLLIRDLQQNHVCHINTSPVGGQFIYIQLVVRDKLKSRQLKTKYLQNNKSEFINTMQFSLILYCSIHFPSQAACWSMFTTPDSPYNPL